MATTVKLRCVTGIFKLLKYDIRKKMVNGALESTWLMASSGMTKIIFNSYSIDSLGLIQQDSASSHKFGAIIAWIKGLLSRSWKVSIQHALNEDNLYADYLAKLVAKGDERF
ncbi:hypothetical protein Peur_038139 [Populus x canadensis]